MPITPDRHANQIDPVSGSRPTIKCSECGQMFAPYYYRLHVGPSYNEWCPSVDGRDPADRPYGANLGRLDK